LRKVLALTLILITLSLTSGFNVYIQEKNATVGKPFTLVINASDFSGKVRGIIDFGNSIIKWDCVYLNHEVVKYNIVSSKKEGSVFFEFENGSTYSKTFKLKDNPSYVPSVTYVSFIQEKNCYFNQTNTITKTITKETTKSNENQQNQVIVEKNNTHIYLIVLLLFLTIMFLVALYFYKIGRAESEIINNIQERIEIPKYKKELLEIESESDYKKKAFKLYKLISENTSLKNKIGESNVQKLYTLSFKKELNEEDKSFIDKIINLIR